MMPRIAVDQIQLTGRRWDKVCWAIECIIIVAGSNHEKILVDQIRTDQQVPERVIFVADGG